MPSYGDRSASAGAADASTRQEPLTVTGAMNLAKGALEGVTVRLVGEVSEVSVKRGYKAAYFTVKDERSSLPCMMWMNRYDASGVDLRVGSVVELAGRFTLYAAKGRMNFDVFAVSLAGEGELRQRVANLARKLDAEGLMSPARKRPIPQYPQAVGLVTSPRGDVVHDVLRTMRRRCPMARVMLWGVPVEGTTASADMAEGVKRVAEAGAEVVLLVRGGGSFEDLMPFNDEGLARAIAACPVPVVTGIGHEPDTTIADMVADLRTSTPTAAAEAVSPVGSEVLAQLDAYAARMNNSFSRRLERGVQYLDRIALRPAFSDAHFLTGDAELALDAASEKLFRALPAGLGRDALKLEGLEARLRVSLPRMVSSQTAKLDAAQARLRTSGSHLLRPFDHELGLAAAKLNALSPLAVLGRGYSIARNEAGVIVKNTCQVAEGESVSVRLSDGTLDCTVESIHERKSE